MWTEDPAGSLQNNSQRSFFDELRQFSGSAPCIHARKSRSFAGVVRHLPHAVKRRARSSSINDPLPVILLKYPHLKGQFDFCYY